MPDQIKGDILSNPRFIDKTYREAMDFVVDVAIYLNDLWENRQPDDAISSNMAYSAESMRMTSSLMLVVSWLMVRKALAAGEITEEEALKKENLLGGRNVCLAPPANGFEDLPPQFQEYQARARELYLRIARMERDLLEQQNAGNNPVHNMLNKLDGL